MTMRRTILTTLALAATVAVGTGTAVAAPKADPAVACKGGGFADFVDPVTSAPFANQGQCVSFVRHGGTLVPYVPEPPAPTATIESGFFPYSGGQCTWNVRLTDYPADTLESVDLAFTNGAGFPTTQTYQITTSSTGSAYFTAGFPLYGGTASASTADPAASDTDTVHC